MSLVVLKRGFTMKVTTTLSTAAILFTLLLAPAAFAGKVVQTCSLSGKIELSDDTEFHCDKSTADFTIAPGTQVVTNGYFFKIEVLSNIELNGLKIVSFAQDSLDRSENASPIEIRARSCIGKMDVDNRGLGEDGSSADVTVRCYSATEEFLNKTKYVLDPTDAQIRLLIENKG